MTRVCIAVTFLCVLLGIVFDVKNWKLSNGVPCLSSMRSIEPNIAKPAEPLVKHTTYGARVEISPDEYLDITSGRRKLEIIVDKESNN